MSKEENLIYKARTEREMSVGYLSKLTGIKYARIYGLERGRFLVRTEEVLKLKEILGIDLLVRMKGVR